MMNLTNIVYGTNTDYFYIFQTIHTGLSMVCTA